MTNWENHVVIRWALRLLAAMVIAIFFIQMYTAQYSLGGIELKNMSVSLFEVATGTGEGMKTISRYAGDVLNTGGRTVSFPVLFLFPVALLTGIVFSFIPKLKKVAKYVYCGAFLLNFALVFGVFAFFFGRIENLAVIPNAWFTVSYWCSLAGFLCATALMFQYCMAVAKGEI